MIMRSIENRILIGVAWLFASLMLPSCSEIASWGDNATTETEENTVKFRITVDSYTTRGVLIDDADQMSDFSFTSYVIYDDNGTTMVDGDVHCENQRVVRESEGSEIWICDEAVVLWPTIPGYGLLFRAYSPYATGLYDAESNPEGNGLLFDTGSQSDRNFVINYTMPAATTCQPDLLVADPQYQLDLTTDEVPLNFGHALSALSFGVRGDTNKRITSIEVQNIITSGALTIDAKDMSHVWTLAECDTEVYTVDILEDIEPLDDSEVGSGDSYGNSLTGNDYNIMVIPQTLPDNATLLVKYIDITDETSTEADLTLNLASSVIWRAGIKYNYVINFTTTIIEESEEEL